MISFISSPHVCCFFAVPDPEMHAVEGSRGEGSGWEEEQAVLPNKNRADSRVAGIYIPVYFKLFLKSPPNP